MRIYLPEVKQRKGEAVPYSFKGSLADFFGRDEFPCGGELEVELSARAGGDKVLISGVLHAFLEAECSRCLQPFRQEVKTDFQESFVIIPEAEGGDPQALAAEAANELSVSGNYLYLNEFLRQIMILAQEYNPVCRPDCKGLCAECGADLNRTNCECREDSQIDLRLLKLKELKN